MKQTVSLESVAGSASDPRSVLALLGLGVVESLENGLLTATDAVRTFFHAANCLYVRKRLRDKLADGFMSRGVQLPDLFDALPPEEALREFRRELSKMRVLCLDILEQSHVAA